MLVFLLSLGLFPGSSTILRRLRADIDICRFMSGQSTFTKRLLILAFGRDMAFLPAPVARGLLFVLFELLTSVREVRLDLAEIAVGGLQITRFWFRFGLRPGRRFRLIRARVGGRQGLMAPAAQ